MKKTLSFEKLYDFRIPNWYNIELPYLNESFISPEHSVSDIKAINRI